MKKYLLMIGLLIGFTFTLNLVSHAQTVTDDMPVAGVKPGSLLYPFDKFFEKVSLMFTFSDEKRAEKLSQIAEERLAELNTLDPAAAQKYADELFNEYGLDLEKANLYVEKLASENKISQAQLDRIQNKLDKAEVMQEKIKASINSKISSDVKKSVNQALRDAKFSVFTDINLINNLHSEGYGYGQLIKLQAISDLSGKSITDLLAIPNAVSVNSDNEKILNINVILQAENISIDSLHTKLNEYRDEIRTEIKSKLKEIQKNARSIRAEIRQKIQDALSTTNNA